MSTTQASKQDTTQTLPAIGWESAGIRMTPEEFDAIEEYNELYQYELVDGVLVVNPIPLDAHSSPNEYLGGLLFVYQHQHPEGSIIDETMQERYVRLPNSRRRADRVMWTGLGRAPDSSVDVPAIAVEFVSAGKRSWIRDYENKRDEYLAAGVKEYWIIDRFDRTMTVYSPGPDGPQIRVIQETETYQTELLPGFELPLAQILAQADKYNR